MKQIAFIGTGVMGSALLRAACKSVDPSEIIIYDRSQERTKELAEELGCCAAASSQEAVKSAHYIMFGVHPHHMNSVVGELLPTFKEEINNGHRHIVCSMAAGFAIADINKLFAGGGIHNMPAIRIMPNIPLKISKGVIIFSNNEYASDDETDGLMNILKAGGLMKHLTEREMNAATPVFSCSPAYVYMFIEAMADAGSEIGLTRDVSIELAAMATFGSAAMVLETGKHVAALRDELSTPGGMTITSTNIMEEAGFRGALIKGVLAAYKRSLDMI